MSVQEALNFLSTNGPGIRIRCTDANIPELLSICLSNEFLSPEERAICENKYTNPTPAQMWDKISDTLQRKKEIKIEDVWKIFSGDCSKHILKYLENIYKPSNIEAEDKPSTSRITLSDKKIFWNVPAVSRHFVGRENILTEISNSFQNNKNNQIMITACKGLGGIGKTTIAIQYAYRCKNITNVFWFGAESAANIEKQREKMYKELEINSEWFEITEDWLIIFDNAEDMSDISKFIPNNSGHILITSRNIQWGEGYLIDIDIFTRDEARSLCQMVLPKQYNDCKEMDALGTELGHLPLALTISLFYIKNNVITIPKYLKKFREEKLDMLQLNFKGLQILPSVYLTWKISYDKMLEENSHAAKFLVICAYYPDPDKIFWRNLNYFVFLKTNQFTLYDQVREILIKYSMIKVESDYFTIHRLVQQVLKFRFQKEEAENIFLFCRLRISRHFNINESIIYENIQEFEEMVTILERIDSRLQNVIFRLLIFLKPTAYHLQVFEKFHLEKLQNYAIKNYEKIKNLTDSPFQHKLAHLGYILISSIRNSAELIHLNLEWIITSYGNVVGYEKSQYLDFFATLGDAIESGALSNFWDKKSIKILETIVEKLGQDSEKEVKFISQGFIHHLSEWNKNSVICRFIKYCELELGVIKDLEGLEYNENYICNIYKDLAEAYEKNGNPNEALKYFLTALKIGKKAYWANIEITESFLNSQIKKLKNKLKICTEKLMEKSDDEIIAKCYSLFGFKKEALESWENVIAKTNAKYQSFIEMSLIFHQMSNDTECIKFLTKASKLAKEENLEIKFNTILGYLTKSSENWAACIIFQNILKADYEVANKADCSEYRDIIENLSFCHFAKGDEKCAQDLMRKHRMDPTFQEFKRQLEISDYKKNNLHRIDFPMIELISNDLKYRVTKLMEYSDKVDQMSQEEIKYAENMIQDYENSFPITNMSRGELKFKFSLMNNMNRAINENLENLENENLKFIQILRQIWGEGGSPGYKILLSKGFLSILRQDRKMAIEFYSEAVKNREAKYGITNIKCIPPLFHLEMLFKEEANFEESLKCTKRILKIFKNSNLGKYEKFRNEFAGKISTKIAQREHDISKSRDCDCKMCFYNVPLAENFEKEFNLLSDYESDEE